MNEIEKDVVEISGNGVTQAEYLAVKDFAERAGVTPQRIYQLISKGEITDYKDFKGHKFVNSSELQRFPKFQIESLKSNLQSDLQSDFQNLQSENVNSESDFTRFEQIYKERIEDLQKQIATLTAEVTAKNEQIAVKDTQIAALTEALQTAQTSLKDTTAALTTAQALHAGTIKQQLIEQADGKSEAETEPPKKRGFFKRLFGKS